MQLATRLSLLFAPLSNVDNPYKLVRNPFRGRTRTDRWIRLLLFLLLLGYTLVTGEKEERYFFLALLQD